jgi:NodT family efflux transporter outer membrane factor (OMF) lipoprotein
MTTGIDRRSFLKWSAASVTALGLGACSTVNEAPPVTALAPQSWANGATGNSPFRQSELSGWWKGYRDPDLSALIDEALLSSPTIDQSMARVDAARALARVEGASAYPRVDGAGNALYQNRVSGSPEGVNEIGESRGRGERRRVGTFQSGFDASWEVDLFGRVSNAVASAERNAEVAAEEAEAARVTLVAEIARSYIELRAAETRRAIVANDAAGRERLVVLIRNQIASGAASEFDLQRATTVAQTARARLPVAELAIAAARQRIATLVGRPSAPLQLVRSRGSLPFIKPPRPSLPADLIRTRPEIRAAERVVAKRAADVGVATAELYPRLTLSGTLTIAGNLLNQPLPGRIVTVAGGPALTIPLLDWGQRRATVDAREAELRESIAAYQIAVLQGVEEVEVSLASIRSQNLRMARLQGAVTAARRAFDTADSLFKSGLTGLTERLSAEGELRQAELELIDARESAGLAVVRLYKALGAPRLATG